MARTDIPKAYEATAHEDAIYAAWEKSGFFNPDNLPGDRTEPFTIVLPPPNVTGTLHMGHAVMLAIEDIMVRFARLRGKRALWIPGTDHAAIATQAKVEKNLIASGLKDPRRDLGREVFLKHVEQFASESHDTIVNQVRKMGASIDWSREAYTLDEPRNRAVNKVFKMMYEDGLIYRGNRVINWCPRCQSTLADDEVEHKETTAKFYTFTYDKNFPIAISSTRPETKLGDTAVAVHPEDERYQKFVGKTFEAVFAGKPLLIRVVADAAVDPKFGTGALGVTPSHSNIDAEIAKKNDLPFVTVIGEDGLMTESSGPDFVGQPVKVARKAIITWLTEQGLIQKEDEIGQNLSVCYRCDTPVEPLPKLQWFISVTKTFKQNGKEVTLKGLMQDAVRSGNVKIMPDRFDKTYFNWVDNLRDWNISRQIWFGHRVPVWYKKGTVGTGDKGQDVEMVVGDAPEGERWTQDEDTLDTWFSSGLWTFSTLGWPDKTKDLETFHPTSVLETGYDIIFFWVARMILMTTYALGEVPFKTVYLHGLVRDEQGRKMSKSLGNVIDPLDMIASYGADATRLSLVIGSTPGNDMKLSAEKVAGYRNFTNKLWNISRFVLTSVQTSSNLPLTKGESEGVVAVTIADRWILSRLSDVTARVTKHLEAHELSAAGELLRDFTWTEFADWYLEIAKVQKQGIGDKGQGTGTTDVILLFVLERLMILWHPFMPFVTEVLWKEMGHGDLLIVAAWPDASGARDEESEAAFSLVRDVVKTVRDLRAKNKINPKDQVNVRLVLKDKTLVSILDSSKQILQRLGRAEDVLIELGEVESLLGVSFAVCGPVTVSLALSGVDPEKERARLEKEREETKTYLASLDVKLSNDEFIGKAPTNVVEGMKTKRADAVAKMKAIEEQLSAM